VRQSGSFEGVPRTALDGIDVTENHAAQERPLGTVRAERERPFDMSAQPVGDASDPTPPADDHPTLRTKDDMHALPGKPGPFVEAGLGPTRLDRPRATQPQDGPARWRPSGR
jgi:hypothetical protein